MVLFVLFNYAENDDFPNSYSLFTLFQDANMQKSCIKTLKIWIKLHKYSFAINPHNEYFMHKSWIRNFFPPSPTGGSCYPSHHLVNFLVASGAQAHQIDINILLSKLLIAAKMMHFKVSDCTAHLTFVLVDPESDSSFLLPFGWVQVCVILWAVPMIVSTFISFVVHRPFSPFSVFSSIFITTLNPSPVSDKILTNPVK